MNPLPFAVSLGLALASTVSAAELRLGIIGTDTGHVVEFTKVLHDRNAPPPLAGVRIVGHG